MQKRRITITVDEDLVEALESPDAKSLSATVNQALREKVDGVLHRKAALAWLDELDAKYGEATLEEKTEVDSFLEEIGFGHGSDTSTSGAA